MVRNAKTKTAFLIRFLSVLALFFVAFAHKPIELRATENSEFLRAEFRLPDGTFPVICLDSTRDINGKPGEGRHLHVADCDACRLTAKFICPAPDVSNAAVFRLALAHGDILPEPAMRRAVYPPAAPPRAPPAA
ncbi:hypothetical protein FHS77_001726 [Paenochrobactrum gallinarii]|uniref:DUF2946 domain-containing protein n=1 Tax=Paenochrobactrum gallinarii TaxID=643673 RepID=A0A841LV34_9HYPH|nr:hypothetical protein [Paenochrobactrum gallinarii]MBB6261176.1 hypothetical protein [Paenochrobactrum gallinarii]